MQLFSVCDMTNSGGPRISVVLSHCQQSQRSVQEYEYANTLMFIKSSLEMFHISLETKPTCIFFYNYSTTFSYSSCLTWPSALSGLANGTKGYNERRWVLEGDLGSRDKPEGEAGCCRLQNSRMTFCRMLPSACH